MPTTRRVFLHRVGQASAAMVSPLLSPSLLGVLRDEGLDERDPLEVARDEAVWAPVRAAYAPAAEFLNVESGYYSPAAGVVLEAQIREVRRINALGSRYMRTERLPAAERVRKKLAGSMGADAEEVAFTRNATEALNTVLLGFPLERGEAVLAGTFEYPNMQAALRQRARREGIVLQALDEPPRDATDDEIVAAYAAAMDARTRLVLVSRMVFLNGRLLPVRAIAAMARARGVAVLCDAAHAFAHVDEPVPGFDADFVGSSLHKWLGAPLGNGFLWMRRDRIAQVWPLFGEHEVDDHDIRRFERQGTQPEHVRLGLADAIDFHEALGGKRKEARLRYLKDRWVEQVQDVPRITFTTPLGADKSCAIANVAIDGVDPDDLARRLFDEHGIQVATVPPGVRVAVNLWLSLDDVDRLAAALREIAAG